MAKEYGIEELPALIYFEKRIPSIYQGDISAEEDVLQWLIQQKTEDTIESVNRELLEQLIVNTQYLVVYFCKFQFNQNIIMIIIVVRYRRQTKLQSL